MTLFGRERGNVIKELKSCKPGSRTSKRARAKLISRITLLYRLVNYIDGDWQQLQNP